MGQGGKCPFDREKFAKNCEKEEEIGELGKRGKGQAERKNRKEKAKSGRFFFFFHFAFADKLELTTL